MRAKTTVLSLVIIAALPFTANAENISGDMYVAPVAPTQQNPAPTTNATPPYGRINIDTDDQEHIATTAYVKGAYNSAIAAVNKVDGYIDDVAEYARGLPSMLREEFNESMNESMAGLRRDVWDALGEKADLSYVSDQVDFVANAVANDLGGYIDSKRVEIYTTWDDDDVAEVPLVTASGQ